MTQNIIDFISTKLGVSKEAASQGLAALLSFIDKNAEGTAFASLVEKIPGATELLASEPATAPEGDVFGGLLQAAGSLLAGQDGGTTQVISRLQNAGIDLTKVPELVECFRDKATAIVGPELVNQVFSSLSNWEDLIGKKEA
jgi:hypothetical protein